MTNALTISIAYKAAALQLMVGEANFFANQLDLPGPKPIEVKSSYISPPGLGFGGNIETAEFFFGFYKEAKLWTLSKKDSPLGRDGWYSIEFKNTPSKIDDKGAYQLATQWLSKVEVDVPALQQKFTARVWQQRFFDPPIAPTAENLKNPPYGTAPMSTLPIFYVAWVDKANTNNEAVKLTIDGTKRELLVLNLNDTSFSKRPPLVVTNATELNTRTDPPLKRPQIKNRR